MSSLTLSEDLAWLRDNPDFGQRPATLLEFLGPQYLDIEESTRDSIKGVLAEIMGDTVSGTNPTRYPKAIISGGIGIGKTTIAAIVLPYLVHWVLCLSDPQKFFGLMPGSRIAFMQMSTNEKQAREVIFSDIKARINHSPWFKNYPTDPNFKNQFRWPEKDIWIVPGDSKETTFEGYNILGGILDEADSHTVTEHRDYAAAGYETISNRMTSRFGDKGFILIIGQMKSSTGFAAHMVEEFASDPDAYSHVMTIWESRGMDFHGYQDQDGNFPTFHYDVARKQVIPAALASTVADGDNVMEIPSLYLPQFKTNPSKALRDLAGIPPAVGNPFISQTFRIVECVQRWVDKHGSESPVDVDGNIADWFRAQDSVERTSHMDIAYSANGDALGFCMGHVSEMVDCGDGETKPFIEIDLLMQIRGQGGRQVDFSDIRRMIYELRDTRKFKLKTVTMDGFEGVDMRQQLEKKRFRTDTLSMDLKLVPYHDLRDAINEQRISFPPYMVHSRKDETEEVEIAVVELSQLVDNHKKIDHPNKGSKDVADAMAGVVNVLMGDRRYRRKVVRVSDYQPKTVMASGEVHHPAYRGTGDHLRTPLPPGGSTRSLY